MNKSQVVLLIIILGVILVGTYGLYNSGNFSIASTLVSYTTVYKQDWGHICCIKNDAYDIQLTKFLDQQDLFKCDDYTDECEFSISAIKNMPLGYSVLPFNVAINKCDLNGKNCNQVSVQSMKPDFTAAAPKLDVGYSYKFAATGIYNTNLNSYVSVKKQAKSFYIQGQEDGKIFVQESCVLSSELKGKVPSDGLNELSKTGTNKCQNYMIGFKQVDTKTYTDNGKEVVCQARQIYEVDNEKFKDGTTKKIQGNLIRGVTCCPTEANCGTDFEFQVNNKRQCSINSECPNGGNPIATDATHYVKYSCDYDSGNCEASQSQFVECTLTAECLRKYGEGSVCDLSYANWGKCIKSTKPNYCGDGACNELDGENKQTCPDDCALKCSEDQILRTTTTKENCFIGFPFYWGCKEVTKTECVMKGWNWILIIAIALLILVIILLFFVWKKYS